MVLVKPPPPNLRSNQNETEIHWRSICDKLHLSVGQCDVRYRTEGNHVWPEVSLFSVLSPKCQWSIRAVSCKNCCFSHLCLSLFSPLTQAEKGFYHSYAIENPQLCTTYEFQVRCACEPGLTSDWSAIHTVQGINNSEHSLYHENVMRFLRICMLYIIF